MSRQVLANPNYVPLEPIPDEKIDIIYFSRNRMESLPIIGLKHFNVDVLDGAERAMTGVNNRYATIDLEIIWPGYQASSKKKIHTAGLNRTQLASKVAIYVIEFVADINMRSVPCAESSEFYGIKENGINCDDVHLWGILNTSSTHWQPIICVPNGGKKASVPKGVKKTSIPKGVKKEEDNDIKL